MVSQDLIYSVLPRQTGQVEHQKRVVEKIVRRSALKAVDENEQSPIDSLKVEHKKRRGDRRKNDRRANPERSQQPSSTKPSPPAADDEQSEGLDIYV